ncbi:succinyl-diaminopimelate desuccinylase [Corynebacterium sp. A21]|uniref:succinyl-diaminopimelate desuccinylase n=1 Tax=Corynebacterium sp. A21 TaxID=3457318 RepID=UPI003FCFA5AB
MLDLLADPVTLTASLMDIPSPSHHEAALADAVESALREIPAVEVIRHGNTVLARTRRGLGERVILAGHLDTVPIAGNVPHHRGVDKQGRDTLFGCGAVDMKSGLAVYLHTFATLAGAPGLKRDLTLIAYEGEEVSTEFNGLGHIERDLPEWLRGDIALLGEPSGAMIEAGCQGSIRLRITAHGERAHSARAWLGANAAHKLAPLMQRIAAYRPRNVLIDGCEYREGLNIVQLESGVATNTIPDQAWMFLNFRFAPDRSIAQALAHLAEVLQLEEDLSFEIDDAAAGALPGLGAPAAQELLAAVGGRFRAKYGWTDVARFSALGIPALNFGPGEPNFAHKKDEQCPVAMITEVAQILRNWLN